MPTTNHTSRAPNKNTRAADSQFTLAESEKTSENLAPLRPRGRPGGMSMTTASKITASTAAMAKTAPRNPRLASSAAPSRKPTPLTAFFDPVSTATQRNSPAPSRGASSLTADFEDILAKSLATPDAPCTHITNTTDAPTAQPGSSCANASSAATCIASPAYSVAVRPKRAAIQPADRLVTMPAISYRTNK